MNTPLVSIVITNFNYGKYLKRCIDSIISQTYQNFEIIICDNNSKDNSLTTINHYIHRFPKKISLIYHRENWGSAANFKSGIALIRGKYFINMGADDFLEPNHLETMVNIFLNYPSISQIISHANSIDEDDVIQTRAPFFDGSYLINGPAYASVLMVAGVTSHTSQTIFSTDAHKRLIHNYDFIYSTTIGERSDALMHSIEYDVAYLNQPYLTCRDSQKNETSRLSSDLFQIIEQWSIIRKFSEYANVRSLYEISNRSLDFEKKAADLCTRYAQQQLILGNNKAASRYLILGFILDGKFDEITQSPESIQLVMDDLKILTKKISLNQDASFELRNHSYPPPDGSIPIKFHNSAG